MSAQSPELQMQIAEWRRKAREGKLTKEEMKQVVIALRAGRAAVPQAKAGSRAKKVKPVVDGQALLDELEDL